MFSALRAWTTTLYGMPRRTLATAVVAKVGLCSLPMPSTTCHRPRAAPAPLTTTGKPSR